MLTAGNDFATIHIFHLTREIKKLSVGFVAEGKDHWRFRRVEDGALVLLEWKEPPVGGLVCVCFLHGICARNERGKNLSDQAVPAETFLHVVGFQIKVRIDFFGG